MTAAAEAGLFGAAPIVKVQSIEESKREQAAHRARAERTRLHIAAADAAGGGAPAMPNPAWTSSVMPDSAEAQKYYMMWTKDAYRSVSPGETVAQVFLAQARPPRGAACIDFGAGTGRGALMLALMGGLRVHMVDFASNCLDPEVYEALTTQKDFLQFTCADLNGPCPVIAPYGFCTDVMEHIPPAEVDKVLRNILTAAQHVFFQISTQEDVCGKLIGEPLHLSIHPASWWQQKFNELGCVTHWAHDGGGAALFYVTGWASGEDIVRAGVVNTPDEQLIRNVRTNCARGLAQCVPHESNDDVCMILGGGPSLQEHLPMIRRMREDGVKLITLNGAYNWCLANGLTPSAQVLVDARPFNARFVEPVVDGCKYLIASQCDPALLDNLPVDRTFLWHTTGDVIHQTLTEAYGEGGWFPIPGGATVLLRAIPLFRMLGYSSFHLFGCDSCLLEVPDTRDDREDTALVHHAYAQAENDGAEVIPLTVGGRVFQCHPWMIAQAQGLIDLIKFMGDEFRIEVHGDGLLGYILQYGAAQAADATFLNT